MVCSVSHFISAVCLCQSPHLFSLMLSVGNHMVFTTDRFSEVAIENWPKWDLNPQSLNSVQMLWPTELSGHEFNSHSYPALYSYSNFIVYSVSHFISAVYLCQSPHLFSSVLSVGNHMSVAESADTYGIHHWQILWSSYRKLVQVGFEPTTTEFHSDAQTDWAIRPWVQLALI